MLRSTSNSRSSSKVPRLGKVLTKIFPGSLVMAALASAVALLASAVAAAPIVEAEAVDEVDDRPR